MDRPCLARPRLGRPGLARPGLGRPGLARRAFAEALGTGLLVVAVVGSGIMATRLSPGDTGLRLLENSLATAFALAVLILVFGLVSGAHLNPVISLADWWLGRGLDARGLVVYIAAQIAGAIGGYVLANVMFDLPAVAFSGTERSGRRCGSARWSPPAAWRCWSSRSPGPAAAPWPRRRSAPTSARRTGSPRRPRSPTPP
jgi:glycerol uptake facilitator-like aquaporin